MSNPTKKWGKTPKEGSDTAKSGFKNEEVVEQIFNNWKNSKHAQTWLKDMGFNPSKIISLKAILTRSLGAGTGKSDLIVNIDGKIEGISIKRFSASFNQIDKRWADNYVQLWNIPNPVLRGLKKYAGQKGFQPINFLQTSEIQQLKDARRFYMDELPVKECNEILKFIESNLKIIIKDLLKGRGETSANWLLVVKHENQKFIDSKIISIDKAKDHYSKGGVALSKKGVIKLGKITLQRKGGDGGRETAQMLQFKFSPKEVFDL